MPLLVLLLVSEPAVGVSPFARVEARRSTASMSASIRTTPSTATVATVRSVRRSRLLSTALIS